MSLLDLSPVYYRLAPFSLLPRGALNFWGRRGGGIEEEEDAEGRLSGPRAELPSSLTSPGDPRPHLSTWSWHHGTHGLTVVSSALCFCSSVLHVAWVARGGCSRYMKSVNSTTALTPAVMTERGTDLPRGHTNPLLPQSVAVE